MADFGIQLGDAKTGPVCLIISIPSCSSHDDALETLRRRIRDAGTQIILNIPALGPYVVLKLNPDAIIESDIFRQAVDTCEEER